jgi:hypothetical protein
MTPRLLVLALPALLITAAAARAETTPAAPAPAPDPVAAEAPAPPPLGTRFIAVAVGAAAGAMMPQLAVVDGLVLMSAIMGGMIGDMAYNSAHGTMQTTAGQK